MSQPQDKKQRAKALREYHRRLQREQLKAIRRRDALGSHLIAIKMDHVYEQLLAMGETS